jgi:hypothetical protein
VYWVLFRNANGKLQRVKCRDMDTVCAVMHTLSLLGTSAYVQDSRTGYTVIEAANVNAASSALEKPKTRC